LKIRLTRKFSNLINGIDLSKVRAGETIDLSDQDAAMLMAEGWAEIAGPAAPRTEAHEKPRKSSRPKTNNSQD
jgi:hypothetical protein